MTHTPESSGQQSAFNLNDALRGRQVLVTGGTGFVGGRLIEKLVLEQGAQVRALVRNYGRVARIARLPIELMQGDITDADAVQHAVDGCDVVFHCAYGNAGSPAERRAINVGGTQNVMLAALQAGVPRVVYLSTLRVYGDTEKDTQESILVENAPYRYSGNLYSDTKLDAEKLVQTLIAERGLPAAILQPTRIYGPHGPLWSAEILERLKNDRVILVNGGSGLCNVVYIDDVVHAILLAATVPAAVGETFLISDEAPTTWIEYYQGYRDMLGYGEMVDYTADELLAAYQGQDSQKPKSLFREILNVAKENREIRRRFLRTPEVQFAVKVGQVILPKRVRNRLSGKSAGKAAAKPTAAARAAAARKQAHAGVPSMPPASVKSYASRTRVCIDKAKRVLGYQPLFDLKTGLELTEKWARWADLI